MQEIADFFAAVSRLVDRRLERVIPAAASEPTQLHEAIRWSVFGGGKRFRPALVIATGRTFGADDEKLLNTAAAVEMIHTYSLIHDDLPSMDDDDLRRGRETCHKRFGEASAILAGDALQTMAFKAIADDESLDLRTRIHLISDIAAAAGTPVGMVAGQQLDLDAEGRSASIGKVNSIHRKKTGAMIRASAVAGSVIGNASEAEIEMVARYAEDLGLLFQVTDDLIDISQTTESLGKTAGKDVASSKATYPAVFGFEGSKQVARELLNKIENELTLGVHSSKLLIEIARFVADRTS